MAKQTTSLKLERGVRERLQVIAARETIRQGRRVTWGQLVRQLIQTHLLRTNMTIENETPPSGKGA